MTTIREREDFLSLYLIEKAKKNICLPIYRSRLIIARRYFNGEDHRCNSIFFFFFFISLFLSLSYLLLRNLSSTIAKILFNRCFIRFNEVLKWSYISVVNYLYIVVRRKIIFYVNGLCKKVRTSMLYSALMIDIPDYCDLWWPVYDNHIFVLRGRREQEHEKENLRCLIRRSLTSRDARFSLQNNCFKRSLIRYNELPQSSYARTYVNTYVYVEVHINVCIYVCT